MVWAYNITVIFLLPLYLVSISEQIEYFESYQEWIWDRVKGEKQVWKILLIRASITVLLMSMTLWSDDVSDVVEQAGSIVVPWTSFLIPVTFFLNEK